ncbi:PIG-M-domain-containing protein [Syncephalis plumigaleata]|nr:PIG-M-domain-containing protein [Syncephalis plumigaleata]
MSKRVDFRKVLGLAILLRLVLLVYGEWQDAYMTVKYTDVDYRVFTDAARYCWEGDSPALWLLNPFVATISTRGNAESLLGALVLLVIYGLAVKRADMAAVIFGVAVQLKFYPIIYALPYGHTYLYHVTRRDHRHNFSVWFYDMYLASYTAEGAPKLLAFLPQLIPVVVLGIVFASDPVFALFTQTFAFVAFNKVCTSQYFMWYLCLLPLVLADTRLSFRWRGASLIIMWIATQGAWLNYAYQLEFLGQNTFFAIWLSGLAFFMANIWILVELIQHHNYRAWFSQGKLRRVQFSS